VFVEGTLRWQVTEDCPWDLLMALSLRDLAGLDGVGEPVLPRVIPAVQRIVSLTSAPPPPRSGAPSASERAAVPTSEIPTIGDPIVVPAADGTPLGGRAAGGNAPHEPTASGPAPASDSPSLAEQWLAWWRTEAVREHRPLMTMLQPPHFAAFDRAIELQDLIVTYYDDAYLWAAQRHEEYARASTELHAKRAADIVDVVRAREHELRRQAGYFRLDIAVMPLAEPGAWIVGPNSVVISQSLRDDSGAFREWFTPVIAALV
jgi:hypothetical protein